MSFKKVDFVSYGRSADIMEVTIRDGTRAKIESYTCNVQDKKRAKQIFDTIKEKYGIEVKPEIDYEDSVNFKEKKDFIKSDFGW